jgi:hypothetical protein
VELFRENPSFLNREFTWSISERKEEEEEEEEKRGEEEEEEERN